jgi:hypothetical protein
MQFLAAFLALAICAGCEKADDPVEPVTPTQDDRALYDQASGRLTTGHVYGRFGVVSLKPDGMAEHQGEALIWGGTSLWALSCSRGKAVSDALRAMLVRLDGAMVRVEPLGEYADGRQISMDGVIGAMLGIARRVTDCGEAELWRDPMRRMVVFQNSHGGRLHPDSNARIVGEFKAVRDFIAWKVGAIADEPSADRMRQLEQTVGGWAAAVRAAHDSGVGADACFRVNLGWSALMTLETMGRATSQLGRDQLCAASTTMDIPTVDHWCGRQSIVGYLETYQDDLWEYRHQRCGSWESPDGDGNVSPELDRLVALVLAHGWRELQ